MSSGAIAAGLAPLALRSRPRDLATQQAAASVGQGLLMGYYTHLFAAHGLGVGQVLLTVDDVTRHGHYRNAFRTFGRLLELGVVPVVNENDTVATHEIRFGDNDRLAALVAHLVHADALVLLSDVDSLYTAKPGSPARAAIPEVHGEADLAGLDVSAEGSAVGTGGMVTKVEAARIATTAGIPVVLTSADRAGAALRGEPVGTCFHPTGKRRPTRLLWLRHASDARGALRLDAGAVRALVQRKASLLPAGVTASRARSAPASPSTSSGPTAPSSPAGWSTTTPRSCPPCWAAAPASWPPSWAPATTARWCTATPSSSSTTPRPPAEVTGSRTSPGSPAPVHAFP